MHVSPLSEQDKGGEVSSFSGPVVGEEESEFRRDPLTLPTLSLLERQTADCTVQGFQNVIWFPSHEISSGSDSFLSRRVWGKSAVT